MNDAIIMNKLLKKTARSFYLNLKILPQHIRHPLTVTYLLARLTDTIADSLEASTATKLAVLDNYVLAIEKGDPAHILKNSAIDAIEGPERELFENFDVLIFALNHLEPEIKNKITWVLEKIVLGQRKDITHFSSTSKIHTFNTINELDEYTYHVAGAVGDFWNFICYKKLKNYSPCPIEEQATRGVNFGKALQMVNILRDLPHDIANNRCYLPLEQLYEHNITIESLSRDINQLAPIVSMWQQGVVQELKQGWQYMLNINNRRIRSSLVVMLLLGFATIEKLNNLNYLQSPTSTKVSKSIVRRVLVIALLSRISKRFLKLAKIFSFSSLIPK